MAAVSFLKTIRNKIAGFQDTLVFSNRWAIMTQRLIHPSYPIVGYLWKRRWWLFADVRYMDTQSPKELLAGGCYDLWISKSLCRGDISFVNVGANIGGFDIAVASQADRIPMALSIELNPATYIRLCFNLQINNLHSIKTLNAGVGSESGIFNFRPSDCSISDSLFYPDRKNLNTETTQVRILTLSESLSNAGFSDCEFDLLKLDCEGAEYGIIRESSPECLRRFRNIVVELHPEPEGESVASLYEKLSACGFKTDQPQWVSSPKTELRFWQRRSLEGSTAAAKV